MLFRLLLISLIQSASCAKSNGLSPETTQEVSRLNEIPYHYHIHVVGHQATFSFDITNTTSATRDLNISGYYFSVAFVEKESQEYRTEVVPLPDNETVHHNQLNMIHLEEGGNYFVCVFFVNKDQTLLYGSSRFCQVVSVSDNCNLEYQDKTFSNRHVYVLLIFVVVILLIVVIVTCIRDFIYRPKKIEDILRTLPEHHAEGLEKHANLADERRRRRTKSELTSRLREDSVLSVIYSPSNDNEFTNYHAYDNGALDQVTELDEDEHL